jgi:hypothetical protein
MPVLVSRKWGPPHHCSRLAKLGDDSALTYDDALQYRANSFVAERRPHTIDQESSSLCRLPVGGRDDRRWEKQAHHESLHLSIHAPFPFFNKRNGFWANHAGGDFRQRPKLEEGYPPPATQWD